MASHVEIVVCWRQGGVVAGGDQTLVCVHGLGKDPGAARAPEGRQQRTGRPIPLGRPAAVAVTIRSPVSVPAR